MKKAVLSVNANKAMNFLIETVLAAEYSVISAKDVFHGMKIMKSQSNLIAVVVDIDYDTYENLEFISHLRSSRFFAGCQVIVLSSQQTIDRTGFDKEFVKNVFFKPFSPQALIDHLAELEKEKIRKSAILS